MPIRADTVHLSPVERLLEAGGHPGERRPAQASTTDAEFSRQSTLLLRLVDFGDNPQFVNLIEKLQSN